MEPTEIRHRGGVFVEQESPSEHEIAAMCAVIQAGWTPEQRLARDQYAAWRQVAPHCPGPLAEILRDHK